MSYAIIIALSILIIEHVLIIIYIVEPAKEKNHETKSKSDGKRIA
jgi:hypothetical protein